MSPVVFRTRDNKRLRVYPKIVNRITTTSTTTYSGAVSGSSTNYVLPGDLAGADNYNTLSYAIPTSNVVYYDPEIGTSGGAGTLASPVQTLAQANTKLVAGGTIVIGTQAKEYIIHEGTSIPLNGTGMNVNTIFGNIAVNKANSYLQPYPGARVIYDGTSVQTGWTQSGSTWSKAIVQTLDRGATDSYGKLDNDSRGIGWLWVRSQQWHDLVVNAGSTEQQAKMYPLASWPEQVWIDGVRQTQVATLAEVTTGTFFVDGASAGTNGVLWTSSKYYLGTDPTNKEVRVADLCTAIASAADNVTIRGIKVRRYAGAVWHGGAVKIRSTNSTMENVWVEDCMVGFEHLSADGFQYVKCEAWRCGILGYKAGGSYNGLYDRVVGQYNNLARFNWAPVSGAIKATTTRNVKLVNCRLINNYTKGWWADVSCYGIDIVNCDMSWNEQFGIVNEISAKCRVINTLIAHTGKDAYLWHDTNDSEMWHVSIKDAGRLRNQIYDSANPRPVKIYQDNRRLVDSPEDGGTYQNYGRDGRQPVPDPTINNFLMEKIQIYNSIFDQGNMQFAYYAIEDLQKSQGNSRDISAYGLTANGNLFCRASTTNPSWAFLAPGAGTSQTLCTTIAQWRSVSGQDLNSVEVLGTSPTDTNGILTDANRTKYGPGGTNAVATVALTSEIAGLIGVPVGTYAPGVIPIPVAGSSKAAHTTRLLSGNTTTPARLAVFGDSVSFGAAYWGVSSPKYLNSWPGRERTSMNSNYGDAGSGWVLFNQDLYPTRTAPFTSSNTDNQSWEPRMTFTGSLTEPSLGPHGKGALAIPDGGTAPANYVTITANMSELWLLLVAGSAGVVRYSIDGATSKTAQNTTAAQTVDTSRLVTGSTQHVILRIPVGTYGSHSVKIWGDGGTVTCVGWQGANYSGKIAVDNLSISGQSLNSFLASSAAGRDGLAYIDSFVTDVCMIALGANDYNGGFTLAASQTRLNNVINRVKSNGKIPIGFFPPQSNPSTLYPGNGAPTYTQYVNAFADTYSSAGAPFLNLQKLWAPTLTDEQAIFNAGKSLNKYADDVHPNDSGSADIAVAVNAFLGI